MRTRNASCAMRSRRAARATWRPSSRRSTAWTRSTMRGTARGRKRPRPLRAWPSSAIPRAGTVCYNWPSFPSKESSDSTRNFGAYLSLVERYVRDVEAGGSNPLTPTRTSAGVRFLAWPLSFSAMHIVRSHSLVVEKPLAEAFAFFTPEGERAWAAGWEPRYHHPADGKLERGLVFTTGGGAEHTIWTVVRLDPPELVEYIRTTPGSRTGTVLVQCASLGEARTRV